MYKHLLLCIQYFNIFSKKSQFNTLSKEIFLMLSMKENLRIWANEVSQMPVIIYEF